MQDPPSYGEGIYPMTTPTPPVGPADPNPKPRKSRRPSKKAVVEPAPLAAASEPPVSIDPNNPPVIVPQGGKGFRWSDARALLYGLVPILAGAFVTAGWLTGDMVNLIVPLALALLAWPVQALNSLATWRSYVYNILGAVNVLAIGVGWWTETTWTPWVGLGGMVITNVLAYWFTPTTGTPTPQQFDQLKLARKAA